MADLKILALMSWPDGEANHHGKSSMTGSVANFCKRRAACRQF
jgi:hypothetical protein